MFKIKKSSENEQFNLSLCRENETESILMKINENVVKSLNYLEDSFEIEFPIKQFKIITKSKLSNDVLIELSNKGPVCISIHVENNAIFKFFIAPFVETE